mgnify:CR=1 FL=1
MASRVRKLHDFGQAPWLDFVDRRFLKEGGLQRLVEEDGVTGVTSNPSIFEKAIAHGDAYDAQLLALLQSLLCGKRLGLDARRFQLVDEILLAFRVEQEINPPSG